MMPLNLVFLNFWPADGIATGSVKMRFSISLSENCMRTIRSPFKGSLFLSSQSLVVYVTLPAKCSIAKPSVAACPFTRSITCEDMGNVGREIWGHVTAPSRGASPSTPSALGGASR